MKKWKKKIIQRYSSQLKSVIQKVWFHHNKDEHCSWGGFTSPTRNGLKGKEKMKIFTTQINSTQYARA